MVLLVASMGGQPEALLQVMTAVIEGTGTDLHLEACHFFCLSFAACASTYGIGG